MRQRIFSENCWLLFLLATTAGHAAYPRAASFPLETPLKKTKFYLQWSSVGESFWFVEGSLCQLLSAQGPHLVHVHAGPVFAASVSVSSFVHWSHWWRWRGSCFLGILHSLLPGEPCIVGFSVSSPWLLGHCMSFSSRETRALPQAVKCSGHFVFLCMLP